MHTVNIINTNTCNVSYHITRSQSTHDIVNYNNITNNDNIIDDTIRHIDNTIITIIHAKPKTTVN